MGARATVPGRPDGCEVPVAPAGPARSLRGASAHSRRVAALLLTAALALTLAGCAAHEQPRWHPAGIATQVGQLLEVAGVERLGQITVRDGDVSIIVDRRGEQVRGEWTALDDGFVATAKPTLLTPRTPSELRLDEFERAYAAADRECELTLRGSLTSTIGGAVLTSVACAEGLEDPVWTRSWINWTPVDEFDDWRWSSVDAIDDVLFWAESLVGPQVRGIEFDTRAGPERDDDASATIVGGPFAAADGRMCDQVVTRFLDAAPETLAWLDSMMRYVWCTEPGEGATHTLTGLTGVELLSAVALIAEPEHVDSWLLRFDDAAGSWVVEVTGEDGSPLGVQPVAS